MDRPIEKSGSLFSPEELMNLTRNVHISDYQDKITKLKAKLKPKIDFSSYNVDDEVPSLKTRLKPKLHSVKEKASFELPLALGKKRGRTFTLVDDRSDNVN